MKKLVRMSVAEALAKPINKGWLHGTLPTAAEIAAAAHADDDAPLPTDDELAHAGWTQPVGTVAINLRVPIDVVSAYKALGKGWQTRMNEVLKASAPLRLPQFSYRQHVALSSYVMASMHSSWGRDGLDLGVPQAKKINAKLEKILEGGKHKFTRDDLQFTSELGESLIELSRHRLSAAGVTSKIHDDAEWYTSVGTDIKSLASAMRVQIDGVLEMQDMMEDAE